MKEVTFGSARKKICLKQGRERSGLAEIGDFCYGDLLVFLVLAFDLFALILIIFGS